MVWPHPQDVILYARSSNYSKICLLYEGCSNMNASSFITFFTYMLRQNVIPFWKVLFVAFKMAPNIKKHSLYFSSYSRLYKGHSCILKFFLKQIDIHVLVHVRIIVPYLCKLKTKWHQLLDASRRYIDKAACKKTLYNSVSISSNQARL